jgi:hypothetical protein
MNHVNSILPSMPRSPKWSLLCRFSNQSSSWISHRSYACYMQRPG